MWMRVRVLAWVIWNFVYTPKKLVWRESVCVCGECIGFSVQKSVSIVWARPQDHFGCASTHTHHGLVWHLWMPWNACWPLALHIVCAPCFCCVHYMFFFPWSDLLSSGTMFTPFRFFHTYHHYYYSSSFNSVLAINKKAIGYLYVCRDYNSDCDTHTLSDILSLLLELDRRRKKSWMLYMFVGIDVRRNIWLLWPFSEWYPTNALVISQNKFKHVYDWIHWLIPYVISS